MNIGIRIPRPASVTKKCLHYPVYILDWNVTGHMAFTDMQGDIYITVGEGFWNLMFTPSISVFHLSGVRLDERGHETNRLSSASPLEVDPAAQS